MKPLIPSLLAASFLVIPGVLAQDRPASAMPPREDARMEGQSADRPERREAQRRERPRTGPAAASRPVPPAHRGSPEMEPEQRAAMERIGRMERAVRERDARIGRAVRELSARLDRLESAANKASAARGSEAAKPVADERVRQSARELEERMKRLNDVEKKLGDRARELQRKEEELGRRERELRQMEEKLKAGAAKSEAREKPERETGKDSHKKKDRQRAGEGAPDHENL